LYDQLPRDHPPVRLIGMGVSGFDTSGTIQQTLFDQEERGRRGRLDAVADEIRARYGRDAITRAGTIGKEGEKGTADGRG